MCRFVKGKTNICRKCAHLHSVHSSGSIKPWFVVHVTRNTVREWAVSAKSQRFQRAMKAAACVHSGAFSLTVFTFRCFFSFPPSLPTCLLSLLFLSSPLLRFRSRLGTMTTSGDPQTPVKPTPRRDPDVNNVRPANCCTHLHERHSLSPPLPLSLCLCLSLI